jgi:hypothetical protein
LNQSCDIKLGKNLFKGQSFHDILSLLSDGTLTFLAQAADAGTKEWVNLLQYNDFGQYTVNKLMLVANTHSHESFFNHWHIKDGERSFGPFSFLQMLEFIEQKRLHLDNLIRHPRFSQWEPVALTTLFSEESLRELMSCEPLHRIVCRRKTPRVQYDNEAFLSASGELYRGVTWSLSVKGMGIVTDQTTKLEEGNRVNIIINSNNDHGSVQVKGVVVNLRDEVNYQRVAIEFDQENEFLNQYLEKRIPKL